MMRLAFRFDVGRDFRYVIRRVTGAPVHVAVLFGEHAYEANWAPLDWWRRLRGQKTLGGVRFRWTQSLLSVGEWRVVTLPVTPAQATRAEMWCKSKLGQLYSLFGLVGWKLGKYIARLFDHPRRWICSEYGAGAVHHTDAITLPRPRFGWWNPVRLYRWCVENGWHEELIDARAT